MEEGTGDWTEGGAMKESVRKVTKGGRELARGGEGKKDRHGRTTGETGRGGSTEYGWEGNHPGTRAAGGEGRGGGM